MKIGERIRELRTRDERSLSWLARKSGVSRTHLWQIETGKSSPTYDVILKLCEAFACRPAMLTDEGFMESENLETHWGEVSRKWEASGHLCECGKPITFEEFFYFGKCVECLK